jgi:hypothetical protein
MTTPKSPFISEDVLSREFCLDQSYLEMHLRHLNLTFWITGDTEVVGNATLSFLIADNLSSSQSPHKSNGGTDWERETQPRAERITGTTSFSHSPLFAPQGLKRID